MANVTASFFGETLKETECSFWAELFSLMEFRSLRFKLLDFSASPFQAPFGYGWLSKYSNLQEYASTISLLFHLLTGTVMPAVESFGEEVSRMSRTTRKMHCNAGSERSDP